MCVSVFWGTGLSSALINCFMSMTSAVSQLNFEFNLHVLMIVVHCILIKKAIAHVELTVKLYFNQTHLEL